ncbi:ATP-dependent sacrificial sulfur transferase LarE [Oscillatoria amoena NRMC-F 0135]|nr:ATP-dependent sacrificial sulfur transferase LarE [Oscillatoria amoena NRMC-F 0135]MDL5054215.1 ATP-dependent sacrificial sulfur transferase LarE [Oscillatoria laete-virens NRMC-F 0139]
MAGITPQEKLTMLQRNLRGMGRVLIAYSGGVDSAFLLKAAHDCLGASCLGVIADSPSLPRSELRDAEQFAREIGVAVRVIQTNEINNPDYAANPANRCYFCKHELFDSLAQIAREEKWDTIAYGEIADDAGDHRPGAVAAGQFAIRAPLKEAGMTKADIRALSREWGLPTADKPAMACLASRIPHGEPVTPEVLSMIERAEESLRRLGFREFRIRHHRMDGTGLALARIEFAPEEIAKAAAEPLRGQIAREIKACGYVFVAVDIEGYRRGSVNAVSLS